MEVYASWLISLRYSIPKLQNQATHSLPPPNGHLQAGLRKKRCSILSKLKERNGWRAALASNKRLIPRKSEDAISRIIPVSYLTSPSCPLSAKSIFLPWSKPSFWKKQRERQKSLKLSLELESKNWKLPKIQDFEFSIIQGWGISDPLARDSLLHRYSLQHHFPTWTLSYSLLLRCM